MKTILVIGTLLIGLMCFASGPALKDCDAVSATVSQTIDLVSPALIPEAVTFYELPFAGTIPELGMPIEPAELKGFDSGIWHPPVFSTLWLKTNNFELTAFYEPIFEREWRCQVKVNYIKAVNGIFHICWFDIA